MVIKKSYLTKNYLLYNAKAKQCNINFCVIGDLHNECYGNKNIDLANDILSTNPDVIFLTGDLADRPQAAANHALELIENLGNSIPIYYTHGNHELDLQKLKPDIYNDFISKLKFFGVTVLLDDKSYLTINDTNFCIYGLLTKSSGFVPDLDSIIQRIDRPNLDLINIVLAHDPSWFDELSKWGADIVLSGHIHGGLVRLPIIKAVFAPGFEIFPKYSKGTYYNKSSALFVTAGFGDIIKHARINNPREICTLNLTDIKYPFTKKVSTYLKYSIITILGLLYAFSGMYYFLNNPIIGTITCAIGVISLFLLYKNRLITKKLYLKKKTKLFVRYTAVLFICYQIIMSAFLVSALIPQTSDNATVIVMGCKVDGTKPADMLQGRIDVAIEYLIANPQSSVIASGGKGEDEGISEAMCIKNELIDAGIDESRIYLDEQSTSTYENIENSNEIIEANNLNKNVVIATNEYHQYRSQKVAKYVGLNPTPLIAHTKLRFLPSYWTRDQFGVIIYNIKY